MPSMVDYMRALRMEQLYPREDAAQRLQTRLNQNQGFRGAQFSPTVQDLLDYEKSTAGTPWPKTPVSEEEQQRMRGEIWGDPYAAVNVPTEVIAQPKSAEEVIEQNAKQATLGEIVKSRELSKYRPEQWQTQYEQLNQFAEQNQIDPTLIDILGTMGIQSNKPVNKNDVIDRIPLGDREMLIFADGHREVVKRGQAPGGGASLFYQAIPGSTGYQRFDRRTGQVSPIEDTEGSPLMPVPADTSLAGAKTQAVEEAKIRVEKQQKFPKAKQAVAVMNQRTDFLKRKIDEAISKVSPFTAGLGAWTKAIPASEAKDLINIIETIQANIGFRELQAMRDASPTGGALGQVSEFENRMLQAVQGSLDTTQSPSQLRANLAEIKEMIEQYRNLKNSAYEIDYSDMLGRSNDQRKMQWMQEARKANPGVSESDLENYYNQKYGGQ